MVTLSQSDGTTPVFRYMVTMSQSDGTTPVFRDILAMSQSDGTIPVLRDLLKISVKTDVTSGSWLVPHPGLKPCVHQAPSTVLTLLPR